MSFSMEFILTLSNISELSSKMLKADDFIIPISEFSIRSSVNFFPRIGWKLLIHERLMKIFGFVRLKLVVVRTPSFNTKSATSENDLNESKCGKI